MKNVARLASLTLGSLTALSGLAQAQPRFTVLTDLAASGGTSQALGLSADGRIVVGTSVTGTGRSEAVRWENGTVLSIGDLEGGGDAGVARVISTDGRIVAGQGSGDSGTEACRWVGQTLVPEPLGGTLAGSVYGSAVYGMNASGSVLVGSYVDSFSSTAACMWVNGVLTPLAFSENLAQSFNFASAISADGSTIVGACMTPLGDFQAARIRNGVFSVLPDVPGGPVACAANALSADGRVAVGYGSILSGTRVGTVAVRWVDGVVESLGELPGGAISAKAIACSADGSVVVGTSEGSGTQAFIWSINIGMKSLNEYLGVYLGLADQIGTFRMQYATGVSADGLTVCGYGRRSDGTIAAFVADMHQNPPCPADFNQDGGVDGADVEAFFLAWQTGGSVGDVNQDGGVDGADIEAFFVAWQTGGC
jgi:probable HAF family extracellular repeat protein